MFIPSRSHLLTFRIFCSFFQLYSFGVNFQFTINTDDTVSKLYEHLLSIKGQEPPEAVLHITGGSPLILNNHAIAIRLKKGLLELITTTSKSQRTLVTSCMHLDKLSEIRGT